MSDELGKPRRIRADNTIQKEADCKRRDSIGKRNIQLGYPTHVMISTDRHPSRALEREL